MCGYTTPKAKQNRRRLSCLATKRIVRKVKNPSSASRLHTAAWRWSATAWLRPRDRAAGPCPARSPKRARTELAKPCRARPRSGRRATILANRRAVAPARDCAFCIRPSTCGSVIGSLHSRRQIRQRPLQRLHVLGDLWVGVEVRLERDERLRPALLLRDRRQRLVRLRMGIEVGAHRVGDRADGLGDLAGRARIGCGGCRGRRRHGHRRASTRRPRRRARTRRTCRDGRSHGSVSSTTPYDLRTSDVSQTAASRRQTDPRRGRGQDDIMPSPARARPIQQPNTQVNARQ